jgi:Fe2+ or Zn2+ uptake regulation protein
MTSDSETLLRDAGLRVTHGRIAILGALERLPHSDADTLHRAVEAELASTSVQSIHNVLHDLAEAGLVRKIEPAGSSSRYELRINDNHHHIVCTRCGAIGDVDCVHGEAPCLTPSNTNGFTVQTAEVTFWGLCPGCAATDVQMPDAQLAGEASIPEALRNQNTPTQRTSALTA